MLARKSCQVVVFRLSAPTTIGQLGLLEPHRPQGRGQLPAAARQHPAGLGVFAQPQGAAMPPPNPAQALSLLGGDKGRKQLGGAPFLHGNRLAEHIQGPGLAQFLSQESQILRRGVIDLGLLHQHGFLLHGFELHSFELGRIGAAANGQGEPQQVGAIQAAGAQPHANPLRHVGGGMAKARRPTGR